MNRDTAATVRAQHFALVTALLVVCATAASPGRADILEVPGEFARITDALAAASMGDTVQVAAGTYSPSGNSEAFPLVMALPGVQLLGEGMESSTLDAESTGSVIEISTTGARVSGFTLTGGRGVNGGGVHVISGDPEIDHCLILANFVSTLGSGFHAGAGATPWIHHNVLWENGDTDTSSGGDPHGIQLRDAHGTVEHNVIGRGDSNGLITELSASPTIRNNIFYENGTPALRGRGICVLGAPTVVIAHNLFFGNVIAAILVDTGGGLEDVTAAEANDFDGGDGIYGNVDGDPRFVDVDSHDWHLQYPSPAIDAGEPGSPLDPDGTPADIGPFYYDQTVIGIGGPNPAGFRFHPVAPSPFRDLAELSFSITEEKRVLLTIFGVRGSAVAVLADEVLPPGSYRIPWRARNDGGGRLPAGVYFARLEVGTDSAVRRIVFIP
jgi:hypothetical protein